VERRGTGRGLDPLHGAGNARGRRFAQCSAFNRRRRRVGHLLQGRFKAQLSSSLFHSTHSLSPSSSPWASVLDLVADRAQLGRAPLSLTSTRSVAGASDPPAIVGTFRSSILSVLLARSTTICSTQRRMAAWWSSRGSPVSRDRVESDVVEDGPEKDTAGSRELTATDDAHR